VYTALSSIQIQLLKEEATCREANIVMLKFLEVFLYEVIGWQYPSGNVKPVLKLIKTCRMEVQQLIVIPFIGTSQIN
jgi:hypothetical protein